MVSEPLLGDWDEAELGPLVGRTRESIREAPQRKRTLHGPGRTSRTSQRLEGVGIGGSMVMSVARVGGRCSGMGRWWTVVADEDAEDAGGWSVNVSERQLQTLDFLLQLLGSQQRALGRTVSRLERWLWPGEEEGPSEWWGVETS